MMSNVDVPVFSIATAEAFRALAIILRRCARTLHMRPCDSSIRSGRSSARELKGARSKARFSIRFTGRTLEPAHAQASLIGARELHDETPRRGQQALRARQRGCNLKCIFGEPWTTMPGSPPGIRRCLRLPRHRAVSGVSREGPGEIQ
jgi:hypothetical protein